MTLKHFDRIGVALADIEWVCDSPNNVIAAVHQAHKVLQQVYDEELSICEGAQCATVAQE